MYYAIVCTFMLLLPWLSIAAEPLFFGATLSAVLIAKWFAFWAVGWRLLLAGIKQVAQPQYTAREILGLKSDESLILVRELGFANVATGLMGVFSLWLPSWQLAAAFSGGVFYGLAGLMHALQDHRNRLENVAMVSDLYVCAVLLGVHSCSGAAKCGLTNSSFNRASSSMALGPHKSHSYCRVARRRQHRCVVPRAAPQRAVGIATAPIIPPWRIRFVPMPEKAGCGPSTLTSLPPSSILPRGFAADPCSR
ncbi:MAG: hypothetical protein JSR59_01605 [Proteobacteria bacterium]|nr:hypothetical protein [Pseudomonadota bacterium]